MSQISGETAFVIFFAEFMKFGNPAKNCKNEFPRIFAYFGPLGISRETEGNPRGAENFNEIHRETGRKSEGNPQAGRHPGLV